MRIECTIDATEHQPGSRMPDPFPGGKRAPSPQGVDAAAKRAKVENRIFNMDWCGRFLERLQGHKKVFIQQSVGRQILGSTQDQYLGVDELHPNEVQLILQFIFQVLTACRYLLEENTSPSTTERRPQRSPCDLTTHPCST